MKNNSKKTKTKKKPQIINRKQFLYPIQMVIQNTYVINQSLHVS